MSKTYKFCEEKEISKGPLGSVVKRNKETIFTFYKSNIDKRKKLKEEIDILFKSCKQHTIEEGILKIKHIKTNPNSYTIITEPVIDSLSNIHYKQFKGFEIFKIFQKFNIFIKYSLENKINLEKLKLSDLYLTKNNEIKLLSVELDLEIMNKIKKEKFSDNNKKNILYSLGIIMYYLYYNEYQKLNEIKFPKQKYFGDLIKYCLNGYKSKKFDFDEYYSQKFFHPDKIFSNYNKSNIINFNLYKQSEEKENDLIPLCEDLNYRFKKVQISEFYIANIYTVYDKSNNKIVEQESYYGIKMLKLKKENNKNLYLIVYNKKIFVLKKLPSNIFTITQDLDFSSVKDILELSTGEIAFINISGNVYIFSKKSEDQFQQKLKLSVEIKPEYIFETEENYLCISCKEKTILYDLKNKRNAK